MQNGGLLKHGDRARGQKELLPRGCEEWPILYPQVGRGLATVGKGSFITV